MMKLQFVPAVFEKGTPGVAEQALDEDASVHGLDPAPPGGWTRPTFRCVPARSAARGFETVKRSSGV